MKGPVKRRGTSPFYPGRMTISEILVKKAGNERSTGNQEPLSRQARKRKKFRNPGSDD
ncbi:MAG: hypothetical protein ACYCX4_05550 [Bacillota bacterium]